jgi:ElaB/YqjD/DUF883 family membrane-anchored ribosome-binding protein
MTDITDDGAPSSPKKRASAQAKAAAAAAHDELRSLADEAAERAAQLRQALEERAGAAREWASDQTEVLRDTVSTRPLTSIGVSAGAAFAAGLVLGVLLARR